MGVEFQSMDGSYWRIVSNKR